MTVVLNEHEIAGSVRVVPPELRSPVFVTTHRAETGLSSTTHAVLRTPKKPQYIQPGCKYQVKIWLKLASKLCCSALGFQY